MVGVRRLVLCVVVALAAAPAAGSAPEQLGGPDAHLSASMDPLGTTISLSLPTAPQALGQGTAALAFYAPTGMTLQTRPAGSSIGVGFLGEGSSAGGISARGGTLVVADPATIDAASQACAPGTHAAVWQLRLEASDGTLTTVPVFVDAAGPADPPGSAYKLVLCPGARAGTQLFAFEMLVTGAALKTPTVPGAYTWRVFVTPTVPSAVTPDPAHAIELRGVALFPQSLTLTATYDRAGKRAVLTGRVMSVGKPLANARVSFSAHSAHVRFADFGPARTNAAGRFSITWPISEKTEFTAGVDDPDPVACAPDTGSPPGGCASLTTSVPDEATSTTRPPRRGDPKLAFSAAGRAVAARVNLKLSDLPAGWDLLPLSDDEAAFCPDFQPDESGLSLSGTSSSPFFYSGDLFNSHGLQVAFSSVKVWKTPAEAKLAFARESPAAQLKCLRDDPDTTIVKAAPLPSPRVGRASAAYRIVAVDEDDEGEQLTAYLDVVEILGRRSVVTLAFEGVDTPPAVEQSVAAAVARRALSG
jgi:hypothetical protein